MKTGKSLSPLVVIFLLACFMPLQAYQIGPLALTPSRLVMVLLFFPVLFNFLSGKAGRLVAADFLILGYTLWLGISLYVDAGFAALQYIGITAIEFLTPYLLARTMIRSPEQFRQSIRILFVLVVLMAVNAAFESNSSLRPVSMLFDPLGTVYQAVPARYELRLGMMRAQGSFQHPILFGVVMSLFFSSFFYMPLKSGKTGGALRASASALATFFSLSTGAFFCLATQVGLIAWGRLLRAKPWRWKLLIGLIILAYVTVDMLSNRSPFEVFSSYLAFNSGTGFARVLIFRFGMENVWAHPIFGLGLSDWARPTWMQASVDNFWLLNAMRYGIPGILLLAGSYIAMIIHLGCAKIADPVVANERNGLVFGLIGVALSACSVHLWGTALYIIVFMWGAGGWMLQYTATQPDEETAPRTGLRSQSGRSPDRRSAGLAARPLASPRPEFASRRSSPAAARTGPRHP